MAMHLQGFVSFPSRCATRFERSLLVFFLAVVVLGISCAPKRNLVIRPVPAWDAVEGMGLEPPEGLGSSETSAFERGWRALREGQIDVAYSELEQLSRKYPKEPTIQSAMGYLELRLGSPEEAERLFHGALTENPHFGPAEAGSFLVALDEGDEERALDRLNRLEKDFPQHGLVERYGTTLRVNVAESRLREARELFAAKHYEEAASAYLKALEVAPEAGALYLEAAEAEIAAGFPERAAVHALRATELEPDNGDAFRVLGEARYKSGDLTGSARAFQRAAALRPDDVELRARAQQVEAEVRETTLAPQYTEIAEEPHVTREQLAALFAVELKNALDAAPVVMKNVIATDISESWALPYIRRVVEVGVLEVFPNHMFQPKAFVSRMELARALAKALEIASPETYERERRAASLEEFTDLSREAAMYSSAALAVSLGLIEPGEGGAFEPQRLVTGAEAVSAVRSLALHMTP